MRDDNELSVVKGTAGDDAVGGEDAVGGDNELAVVEITTGEDAVGGNAVGNFIRNNFNIFIGGLCGLVELFLNKKKFFLWIVSYNLTIILIFFHFMSEESEECMSNTVIGNWDLSTELKFSILLRLLIMFFSLLSDFFKKFPMLDDIAVILHGIILAFSWVEWMFYTKYKEEDEEESSSSSSSSGFNGSLRKKKKTKNNDNSGTKLPPRVWKVSIFMGCTAGFIFYIKFVIIFGLVIVFINLFVKLLKSTPRFTRQVSRWF